MQWPQKLNGDRDTEGQAFQREVEHGIHASQGDGQGQHLPPVSAGVALHAGLDDRREEDRRQGHPQRHSAQRSNTGDEGQRKHPRTAPRGWP